MSKEPVMGKIFNPDPRVKIGESSYEDAIRGATKSLQQATVWKAYSSIDNIPCVSDVVSGDSWDDIGSHLAIVEQLLAEFWGLA